MKRLTVRIILTPDLILAVEPVPGLEPLLESFRTEFYDQGKRIESETHEIRMYVNDFRNRLIAPIGYLHRIEQFLLAKKYKIEIQDRRTIQKKLKIAPHARTEEKFQAKLPLLKKMKRKRMGRIEVVSREDLFQTIALIVEAFPQATIGIVMATSKMALEWFCQLHRRTGYKISLRTANRRWNWTRILVTLYTQMPADYPVRLDMHTRCGGEPPIEGYTVATLPRWDLLLVPDGYAASVVKAIEMLYRIKYDRIFAFGIANRRRDRLADICVEAMAGPFIHRVKKPRAHLKVIFIPVALKNGKRFPNLKKKSALEQKRKRYWRNKRRNQLIVSVVMAIFDQDEGQLREFGFDDADIDFVSNCPPEKCLLLVENTRHAKILLRYDVLKEWRFLNMMPDNTSLPEGSAHKEQKPTPIIVTESYAQAHQMSGAIVIRATGSGWPLKIRKFPPLLKRQARVLVIDFDDLFEEGAKSLSEYRRKHYEESR